MSLDDRVHKAEDALKPEEAGRDILLTCVTEQHERVDGELVSVRREPTGYTEIEWGPPGKNGSRIGVRYALYDGQPSNWKSKRPPADAEETASHGIVRDEEVTGD